MKEVDRLKTIEALAEGRLTASIAAQRINLSTRQVYNLLARYRVEGPLGLRSLRVGKPSNHQLPTGMKELAGQLILQHYPDFGPTLAAEKLVELHDLHLAVSTVRQLMINMGLWVPRRQRPPRIQQPRYRRACFGELIQIDGCDHRWFEERGPACTAIVFVDDATSQITALRFVYSESTFAYFSTLRDHLSAHGKPLALYSDKASVFRVNHKSSRGEGQTQFARALDELNIEGFCAHSSAAKGRVERAHLTLQDRLVKELRLAGISSIDDANKWLPDFIADYNRRFGKAPLHELDVHRPLNPHDNLDHILLWKEPRLISKRLTTQYDKVQYLLMDTPSQRRLIGREIVVYHYCDDRVELRGPDGNLLDYCINDRLAPVNQGAIVDNKRLGHVLQMAQEVQTMRDDVRSRSLPNTPTANRRRGPHPDKVKPNRLGEEQYYKALLDVSGERMEAQLDRLELADIANEATQTAVKRKRGRPQITGPR
nr:ISNCY family transposase [Citrobacter freundii]